MFSMDTTFLGMYRIHGWLTLQKQKSGVQRVPFPAASIQAHLTKVGVQQKCQGYCFGCVSVLFNFLNWDLKRKSSLPPAEVVDEADPHTRAVDQLS